MLALLFASGQASRAAAAPGQGGGEATPLAASDTASHPSDPWERLNRKSFEVSNWLDRVAVGPLAHAYMRVTPPPVRRGLGRFVGNLREPRTVLNDLVQAHAQLAGKAAGRFVINSTIGLGGFLDPATRIGLAKHTADFGQTLGRYGVGAGPYLYVPILGPLDVRDGVGRLIDAATDPISILAGGTTTAFGASRLALSAVDSRASLDSELSRVSTESADPYATIRSAYSQRRAYLVSGATGQTQSLPDFDAPPDQDRNGAAARDPSQ